MSICRCSIHDLTWDSDLLESCPYCKGRLEELEELEVKFLVFIEGYKKFISKDENTRPYKYFQRKLSSITDEIEGLKTAMFS